MPATVPQQPHQYQQHVQREPFKHRHEDEVPMHEEHLKHKKRDLEAAYHEFKMLIMHDLAMSMF